MRRPPPTPKPVFQTRDQVQAQPHYTTHVDVPQAQMEMARISDIEMNALYQTPVEERVRGVPTSYNYAYGVLRVWPWPAEGWQVWSGVHRCSTP